MSVVALGPAGGRIIVTQSLQVLLRQQRLSPGGCSGDQAALIGVFNAVRSSAPALGEALKALVKAFDPAVNELIILAGHAIRQLISQVYQTLKQKVPELVQIWTMVITGASDHS